jgi:metal-responsive CopG/Arc/MetJ family transcriptional regulator
MGDAIGIRLTDDLLRDIEELSKEEKEDRSTTIRKLVTLGYKGYMQKKAAEEYKKGIVTFSEAARRAGLTIWEMEKCLVDEGITSSYTLEDLERESRILDKKRQS